MVFYNIMIRNIALFVCFMHLLPAMAQEDWELKKEEDGIKVYTKYMEGSDIKAFRVEAVMEGKLSGFVALLKDVASYSELFETNTYAEVIEATDTSLLYYSRTGVPWPLKDRDGVYRLGFSQHYGTKAVTVTVRSVEGIRPADEGYVRINSASGKWMFFPVDLNKVEVIYQMQADPGGNLPAWVINMFLVDTPLKDMKNIRERVRLPQYEGKRFEFLIEY